MTPIVLSVDEPEALERTAAALSQGLVVAVPTDTVYGLAVTLDQPGATAGLAALKGRPPQVPFAVLVAGPDQLGPISGPLEPPASRLADAFWPGPLTLVVARAPGFDADLGGDVPTGATVGIRWPADPVVGGLARLAGPLVTTSANRHGTDPISTAEEIRDHFDGDQRLAIVLDGGARAARPSTVVDCTGPAVRCLREGAVDWADVVDRAERGDRGPVRG